MEHLVLTVIAPDRQVIIAVGLQGLYRFSDGAWTAIPLPAGVDAATFTCTKPPLAVESTEFAALLWPGPV